MMMCRTVGLLLAALVGVAVGDHAGTSESVFWEGFETKNAKHYLHGLEYLHGEVDVELPKKAAYAFGVRTGGRKVMVMKKNGYFQLGPFHIDDFDVDKISVQFEAKTKAAGKKRGELYASVYDGLGLAPPLEDGTDYVWREGTSDWEWGEISTPVAYGSEVYLDITVHGPGFVAWLDYIEVFVHYGDGSTTFTPTETWTWQPPWEVEEYLMYEDFAKKSAKYYGKQLGVEVSRAPKAGSKFGVKKDSRKAMALKKGGEVTFGPFYVPDHAADEVSVRFEAKTKAKKGKKFEYDSLTVTMVDMNGGGYEYDWVEGSSDWEYYELSMPVTSESEVYVSFSTEGGSYLAWIDWLDVVSHGHGWQDTWTHEHTWTEGEWMPQ